jgi:hypothetical protein
MQIHVEAAGERVKDRPWYFAFAATEDFRRVIETPPEDSADPEKDDMEEDETLYRMMVAALIENVGGADKTCSHAHQAALYLRSARKDHQKAAALFEKKAGGPRAVQAEMDAWSAAHEEEIRESAGAFTVRAAKYEGKGPQTMEESLEFWTNEASNEFSAGKPPSQFAVGMTDEGSGMLFKSEGFEGSIEKQAFDELVNQQCTEHDLSRQVRVDAAWIAKTGRDPEQAKGSDDQEEVILVKVIEGEKMIANILRIDWTAFDGQPRLSPPERVDGNGL